MAKYKVTMRNFITTVDENGVPSVHTQEANDYVPEDMLEVYVADANTRWQSVTTSDAPDDGPGGADGETAEPEHLIGRTADDFAQYGDSSTPDNALDEWIGKTV